MKVTLSDYKCPGCGEPLERRVTGHGVVYVCKNSDCRVISVHYRYGTFRRGGPKGIKRIKTATLLS